MRSPFALLILVLLFHLPVEVQASSLDDIGKQLLTHPLVSPASQMDALQTYLRDAADEQTPASLVLTSHARLQLAALQLQQGNNEQSRATLMALPQTSPVAVPAALLLAQTWLAENKDQEAMQWYLRTIQRYPYHPQALAGLLDAATLLRDGGDTQAPLVLCEKVTQNSLEAVKQLQKLQFLAKENGLPVLIEPQEDIDPAIQQQLMEVILHNVNSSSLDDGRQANRFTKKHRQLLLQLNSLQQARADTAARMQQIDQAIALLQQRIAYANQQIENMKKTLDQADNDTHTDLRKQLVQMSNRLKGDLVRRDYLEQNRTALPAISARLQEQLAILLPYVAQQQKRYTDSFTASIQTSGAELDRRWHDIAARGQLMKAELMMISTTKH